MFNIRHTELFKWTLESKTGTNITFPKNPPWTTCVFIFIINLHGQASKIYFGIKFCIFIFAHFFWWTCWSVSTFLHYPRCLLTALIEAPSLHLYIKRAMHRHFSPLICVSPVSLRLYTVLKQISFKFTVSAVTASYQHRTAVLRSR